LHPVERIYTRPFRKKWEGLHRQFCAPLSPATARRERQLTGDHFMTTNFAFWPQGDLGNAALRERPT
jgi:hypothetical protein